MRILENNAVGSTTPSLKMRKHANLISVKSLLEMCCGTILLSRRKKNHCLNSGYLLKTIRKPELLSVTKQSNISDIFNSWQKTFSSLVKRFNRNDTKKSFVCRRRTWSLWNFIAVTFISHTNDETANFQQTSIKIIWYLYVYQTKRILCIKYVKAMIKKMIVVISCIHCDCMLPVRNIFFSFSQVHWV